MNRLLALLAATAFGLALARAETLADVATVPMETSGFPPCTAGVAVPLCHYRAELGLPMVMPIGPANVPAVDAMTVTVPGGTARTMGAREQDITNVADFGALGLNADYTSQITRAFAAAKAAKKIVRFPCGTYILGATIETSGVPWFGDGESCVVFRMAVNAPHFRMTINGASLQYAQIGGFTCRNEIAAGQTYSSTACVDIEGDNASYVQDDWFHDIAGQGTYAVISSAKGDSNGPFGFEGRVSTNTFSRIRGSGYTNPAKYRFWFKTGSGTANVFEGMSGGSEGANYDGQGHADPAAAVFRFEGKDPSGNPVVVGDISFTSSQFQGPTRIVSVGAGAIYLDNINWTGSQFDGVGNPISFDAVPGVTPRGLRLVDSNVGGGIDIYAGMGTPVQGSLINDQGTSKWAAGVTKNPANTSYGYFRLEIGGSLTATSCDFTFQGAIGAYGVAYARVRYAFLHNGGATAAITPALTQQSYVNSDGTVLSAANGSPAAALSTTAAASSPVPGANPTVLIGVAFADRNGGDTIEGQAECSGGIFRLQRVTN